MWSRSELVSLSSTVVSFIQTHGGYWCNGCLEALISVLPQGGQSRSSHADWVEHGDTTCCADAVTCFGCLETKKCIRVEPAELKAA